MQGTDSQQRQAPFNDQSVKRRLPIGAEITLDGVHFRVWAPRAKQVEVVLEGEAGTISTLSPEADGYFSGFAPEGRAASLYRFRLDGNEALYPDPASRFQPDGPH